VKDLQQLLSPYAQRPLSSAQLHSVELYLNLLLKWNAKMNLTAIRDADEIVRRHFGESFFAGERLALGGRSTLIDVGSGAGFPGLPIKLLAPHLSVTLIEAQQKKVAFLREVVRALDLQGTSAFAGRAEDAQLKAQIVTLRAVEKFESALETAASLLEAGGQLALLIGASQADSARRQLRVFDWQDPIVVPESQTRILLIGTNG
jgi:16S rRNA (guanine527-N7)-methyltransferase